MRLNQTSLVNPFSKKDKFADITRQSIKEVLRKFTSVRLNQYILELQITNLLDITAYEVVKLEPVNKTAHQINENIVILNLDNLSEIYF